jgi:hypothetical protein
MKNQADKKIDRSFEPIAGLDRPMFDYGEVP